MQQHHYRMAFFWAAMTNLGITLLAADVIAILLEQASGILPAWLAFCSLAIILMTCDIRGGYQAREDLAKKGGKPDA